MDAARRPSPAEPDFVQAAKESGEWLLAFWPHDDRWRAARWDWPNGTDPHWCLDGRTTPGASPVAFAPMPPVPQEMAALAA
jgi:hypothetical protein